MSKLAYFLSDAINLPEPRRPRNVNSHAFLAALLFLCFAAIFVGLCFLYNSDQASTTVTTIAQTDLGPHCAPLSHALTAGGADHLALTEADSRQIFPSLPPLATMEASFLYSNVKELRLALKRDWIGFQAAVGCEWTMQRSGGGVPPSVSFRCESFAPGLPGIPLAYASVIVVLNSNLTADADSVASIPITSIVPAAILPMLSVGIGPGREARAPFACESIERKSVVEILALAWASVSFFIGVVLTVVRRCTLYWDGAAKETTHQSGWELSARDPSRL